MSFAKAQAKLNVARAALPLRIVDKRRLPHVTLAKFEPGHDREANLEYCRLLDLHDCGVEDITLGRG